ncbi:retrovirus-related pol polyprotein from transposon TNT 1-94 [Tanacetum coccineum]
MVHQITAVDLFKSEFEPFDWFSEVFAPISCCHVLVIDWGECRNDTRNDDYLPYVPAFDPLWTNNITIPSIITPTTHNINPIHDSPNLSVAYDHPVHNESDDFEPDILESQNITSNVNPISEAKPSTTIISPSVEINHDTSAPQDKWSIDKHILLVNILGKPLADVTTRSRVRDFEAASAHECLYGYKQEEGIEYDETFVPVSRLKTIKFFLAYAAYIGFVVYQMDVKSAFLNGKLFEEVFVQQPPGFGSSEFPNYVCKLDKALYGLKQALRVWYETLSKFLIQHKFVREKYVKDLLKNYELADCASVKCPMLPPNNLGPDESGLFVMRLASRPDIQLSTCLCARYQANPEESHLVADKIIFKYLKGTLNIGLWYPNGSGFDLKAYSDSNYAGGNLDIQTLTMDQEKYFRGCQILGRKLVCWSEKKQNSVAMSFDEAEYVAAAGCCAQVL